MWLSAPDPGANEALVQVAIWGAIGTIGAAAVTGLMAIIKLLADRWRGANTAPVTPAQPDTSLVMQVGSLLAQSREHTRRHDDTDQSQHVQDMELRDQRRTLDEHHRRLQRLERWAGQHDEDWTP